MNLFIHEATIDRLLSYSIFGRDKIPTSKEDSFFTSARQRTIRLLRYSTYWWDVLPISQKDLYIHETIGQLLREHSTTTVLEETNQDSQYQGNQPIGRQLKRKYYTS